MSDPAEHYREFSKSPDGIDHAMAMQAIGVTRMLLAVHRERFETFLEARRDMDSFGHILNPTLYRDVIHSRSMAQQVKMVEAALAFLREVDAVAGELSGGDDRTRPGIDPTNVGEQA
jgi:hypothetical protein